MRDPYRVLGVDRSADTDTIRKAYRKLARQWHPDVNHDAGASERFKEVNAAYDVIGDEEKRRLYDEFGEASTRPGFDAARARAWGGRGGRSAPFGGGVDVDDLIGSIFGGGGFERGPRRGADQQLELTVDLITVVLGGERTITIRRPDGARDTLDVPIPAGAKNGGKVRLKGQGLPPRGGGPCGDLVVRIKVAPHPVLQRDGDHLEIEVPITILEALRGGTITVPTPMGDIRLTVPAGVKSGARLRVKGRGIQRKGAPGDLFVILRPTVPESTDPEVLAAAERIERAYDTDPRATLKI
ncbi:MAG: DnaJ domain-containing protein [Myxococcales bacterium]|nr:DnaJ domain-containing protein [Myxococcales bacterium]